MTHALDEYFAAHDLADGKTHRLKNVIDFGTNLYDPENATSTLINYCKKSLHTLLCLQLDIDTSLSSKYIPDWVKTCIQSSDGKTLPVYTCKWHDGNMTTIVGGVKDTAQINEEAMNTLLQEPSLEDKIQKYKATLSEVLQYIDQQKSD